MDKSSEAVGESIYTGLKKSGHIPDGAIKGKIKDKLTEDPPERQSTISVERGERKFVVLNVKPDELIISHPVQDVQQSIGLTAGKSKKEFVEEFVDCVDYIIEESNGDL